MAEGDRVSPKKPAKKAPKQSAAKSKAPAKASAKSFVHESAYVDAGARIGDGTKVWHFCHVMPGAVIGKGCSLGQNVVVMGGTKIGDNVKIQNNVSIYEGVELENDVFCGPSMVFTNVMNPRSAVSRKHEYQRTLVKRGATIGANATIVCGVTLGEYSFVGAGAVVTRDVAPYALMTGVPAKRTGWMCECGVKLKEEILDMSCASCGRGYARKSQALTRVDA
jgi:UDP-2-acetamido-3-amino-2,3-dideoxy-glucuronate N-acetyltransferase